MAQKGISFVPHESVEGKSRIYKSQWYSREMGEEKEVDRRLWKPEES